MGFPNFADKGTITSQYYGFDWKLDDYILSSDPDEDEALSAERDCQDDAQYYIKKAENLLEYIHGEFGEIAMEECKYFNCFVMPVAYLDYGNHSGVRVLSDFCVQVNEGVIEVPLDWHDNYDRSEIKAEILEEIDRQVSRNYTRKQLENYYGKVMQHIDKAVTRLGKELDHYLSQHCSHIHGTGWCGTSQVI